MPANVRRLLITILKNSADWRVRLVRLAPNRREWVRAVACSSHSVPCIPSKCLSPTKSNNEYRPIVRWSWQNSRCLLANVLESTPTRLVLLSVLGDSARLSVFSIIVPVILAIRAGGTPIGRGLRHISLYNKVRIQRALSLVERACSMRLESIELS